jgi:hypothetical protein
LVKFTEASPKQSKSKTEAKQKQSESNAHNHKTIKNEIDLINNKNNINENEISIQVSKKNENDISKWFKRCSETEFISEVQKFRNEHPDNGYPEILFKDFINHYTTPNENGGIRVNQFSSFGIKNKLYEWKEDIKHAGIKTPKKRIHYE